MESNQGFVTRTVERLYQRFASEGLQELSHPERVVLLTWVTLGDVNNGGFRHFYEHQWPVQEVADAFEELGFPEAAQACRGSSTFFPPEVMTDDKPQTRAWLVHLWEQTEDDDADDLLERVSKFFRPFDHVITALEPLDGEGRLSARLADYIRGHAGEFQDDISKPPPRPRRWPNRRAAMS